MTLRIGETWNESSSYSDPITLRRVIRLTTYGQYNQTPTYHTNTCFSEDGKYLVFASARGSESYIVRGCVETGDLKALYGVRGVGSRDYMHVFDFAEMGNGNGLSGNRLALAPKSGWAVFTHNTSLKVVNIYTCEVKTLIENIGDEWVFGAPSFSPDETAVVVALSSSHPQLINEERLSRSYISYPDHKMKLLTVKLTSCETQEIFFAENCQCSHSSYSTSDNDIILFDKNVPPKYWCGNDGGKTPRIWLVSVSTRKAWPLRETYPGVFQVHSAWTWNGDAVVYHGFLKQDGYSSGIYIGVTAKDGTPIRDYVFPNVTNYGHVNPDPKRPAIILDGDLNEGCISWLYYDDEKPKLETICRHDTAWESIPGQYSHPHPQSDPTGSWISFNKAQHGRSDVFIVEV